MGHGHDVIRSRQQAYFRHLSFGTGGEHSTTSHYHFYRYYYNKLYREIVNILLS